MKTLLLIPLLLLTLNSHHSKEKDKKLTRQFSQIQEWLIQKNNELNGFIDWDIQNPNVIEAPEWQSVAAAQKDIRAIDERIIQISTKKGLGLNPLVLEQKTVPTTTTKEETLMPKVEYAMGAKGGPEAEVIVTVLEEEDFNPATFKTIILSWLGDISVDLYTISTKDHPRKETEIDLSVLGDGKKNIVKIVVEKLQSELTSPTESTVGAIAAKLRKKVLALIADETWILKEYNANKGNGKEAYKKIDALPLPTGAEFVTFIKRPVDVVEAERVAKAEEDSLFLLVYYWRDAAFGAIGDVASDHLYDLIDTKLLLENEQIVTPKEANDIKQEIIEAIKGVLSNKENMQVLAFRDAVIRILGSYQQDTAKFNRLLERYRKDPKSIVLPKNIDKWIEKAIIKSNSSGFIESFNKWQKDTLYLVANLCEQLESNLREDSYYYLDPAKIKAKAGLLFDKTVEGTNIQPAQLFWANFSAQLSKPYYSASNLREIWENAMNELNDAKYHKIYTEIEAVVTSSDQLKGLGTALIDKKILPNYHDIILALYDCEYQFPKEEKIIKEEEEEGTVPAIRKNDVVKFTGLETSMVFKRVLEINTSVSF